MTIFKNQEMTRLGHEKLTYTHSYIRETNYKSHVFNLQIYLFLLYQSSNKAFFTF